MHNLLFIIGKKEFLSQAVLPDGSLVKNNEGKPLNWEEFIKENSSIVSERYFLENAKEMESFSAIVSQSIIDMIPFLLLKLKTGKVVGVWKPDGTPLGWTLETIFDKNGVVSTKLIQEKNTDMNGTTTNAVDYKTTIADYILTMPDIPAVFDAKGVLITQKKRPVKVDYTSQFSGWEKRTFQ